MRGPAVLQPLQQSQEAAHLPPVRGGGAGGARGLASPGPAAAAPAGAPGLARGGWGRRGRCPVPGRPEGVRPSPSQRGGGPGTGEVPAREARPRLGRLGARGEVGEAE